MPYQMTEKSRSGYTGGKMHILPRPVENGIVLRRRVNPDTLMTEVETNVPQRIVYHSPTGFEWGYGGSGPADLALNLAELVVEKAGLNTVQGTHCSMLAWDTSYLVKDLLIEHVPEAGGFIHWKMVCYAVLDALFTMPEEKENAKRLIQYIWNAEK